MPRLRRDIFVLLMSAIFTVVSLSDIQATIELPPEMMADKYLIKAEQLPAKEDYAGAFIVMEEIIALQKQHELKLSDGFHFKYARIARSADSAKIAIDSIGKYLAATWREGEFYRDALALLLEAEESQIRVEETCTGKPEGSSCWKELANLPQCYVWDDYFYEDQTVTWSGNRSGSVAHGQGTLIWVRDDEESSGTGRLERDRKQGCWVVRGRGTSDGPFVDGKRHGHWVTRWDDGDKQRGEFVAGSKKANGRNFPRRWSQKGAFLLHFKMVNR